MHAGITVSPCLIYQLYILLYKLIVECPWPDHEGWDFFNSHDAGTLSIPLITGRGTGTDTCGMRIVLPSDDLVIGLDTYMNCILI